jgi:hypothetical protein
MGGELIQRPVIPNDLRKVLVVEPAVCLFLLFPAGIENTIVMEAEVQ